MIGYNPKSPVVKVGVIQNRKNTSAKGKPWQKVDQIAQEVHTHDSTFI